MRRSEYAPRTAAGPNAILPNLQMLSLEEPTAVPPGGMTLEKRREIANKRRGKRSVDEQGEKEAQAAQKLILKYRARVRDIISRPRLAESGFKKIPKNWFKLTGREEEDPIYHEVLQENKGQGEEGATYCFKVEFERTRPNGTKKTQSKCIWHDAKLLAYWVGKQVRNGQDPTEPATRNPIPIKDLKILSDAFPDYFPPGFDATNRAPLLCGSRARIQNWTRKQKRYSWGCQRRFGATKRSFEDGWTRASQARLN